VSESSLLLLVIVSGMLFSFNPTTIAICVALLMGSTGKGHTRAERHVIALSYLITLFIIIAIAGFLLVSLLVALPATVQLNVSLLLSIVGIVWGIVSIKDYYWYGSHRDISSRLARTLHTYTVKKNDPTSATILGFITAYATVPSIGIPLLLVSALVALSHPYKITFMACFAGMILLPLIIIFIAYLRGLTLSSVIKWKEDSKGTFRLVLGLSGIFLSWLILLSLNGTIAL